MTALIHRIFCRLFPPDYTSLFQTIIKNQKQMSQELDQLRSDLQQTKEKQEATNQKLDNIQADTTKLLDKLNNIPGIPQDVLDLAASINASAGAINEKAGSIDDQVPDKPTENGGE